MSSQKGNRQIFGAMETNKQCKYVRNCAWKLPNDTDFTFNEQLIKDVHILMETLTNRGFRCSK